MGRYIPVKYSKSKEPENKSIYAPPNAYGYRINILHPVISKYWERYRKSKGIPYGMPASDDERFEFERIMFEAMERKKVKDKEGTL